MKRPIRKRANLLATTAILLGSAATANAQVVMPLLPVPEEEAQKTIQRGIIDQQVEANSFRLTKPDKRSTVKSGGSKRPVGGDLEGGNLDPFAGDMNGGNLDPFSGSLDGGNLDPFAGSLNGGNIDPFGGTIDPFGGLIDPFGGTIDPFGGTIDPFGRTIDPFAGNIDPFGGNLNPFHGEVRALWGSIDPFGGSIDPFAGNIDPFAGNIDPFYGQIDPYKGNIDPFSGVELPSYIEINQFWHEFGATWWSVNKLILDAGDNRLSLANYLEIQSLSSQLVSKTEAAWGEAISAKNGRTVEKGFLNPLLAKYGLSATDLTGLIKLSRAQRAQLVSEWFDGLMDYSGFDHVDHWMKTINWNPELTRIQGSGADSVIGILDGSIINSPDLEDNIFQAGGYTAQVGGHGTGVASLMIAAHDGRGVMGIAPNASVATYNPFDITGTASWADIRNGIVSLKQANASVINMSLGIAGWTLHPEWNNVLNDAQVRQVSNSTVFVIAAGNDGSSQSDNVKWQKNSDASLIIVGAVDAMGNISNMSNRPGTACFTEKVKCAQGSYLRDNFIVAPGELILVDDGYGGLVRRSGTSFAAPLVSGAITLLHDRWPWLADHPEATVDIILSTARDLGEVGTDNIYGRGLLDVEASQSPINFDSLTIYEHKAGVVTLQSTVGLKSSGVGETWNTEGVFLTMFETIGGTHRDFAVPFSDLLIGQQTRVNGSPEYFQSYITKRFKKWAAASATLDPLVKGLPPVLTSFAGFSDVASYQNPDHDGWNFGFSMSSPTGFTTNGRPGDVPHSAFKFSNEEQGLAFHAGYGLGSMTLLGQSSFGLTSDYDANSGGLNPVLGLASGGGFMDAEIKIGKNTKIAFGLTNRSLTHADNDQLTQAERARLRGAADYEASAFNFRLSHQPSRTTSVSVSFATMDEKDGLLGVQSAFDGDLRHGSTSKTATLSGSIQLPHRFTFDASATIGMTNSNGGDDQNLHIRDNVMSSAFAIAMGKRGVIGSNDQFRLSVSQPLHIERGTLEYRSIEVINRQTGEIGSVTRSFGIADKRRRFNGEFIYATPIMEGGELSFFGRAEYDSSAADNVNQIIAGGMLSLAF